MEKDTCAPRQQHSGGAPEELALRGGLQGSFEQQAFACAQQVVPAITSILQAASGSLSAVAV